MLAACATVSTEPRGDELPTLSALRHEGLQSSLVMDHLGWLADVHGPRLTGTPGLRAASDWAMDRWRGWGLTGVQREHFRFGEGWELKKTQLRMLQPQPMQIIAYPIGWTPGTAGEVQAEVVYAPLSTEQDLARWSGKLAGKIVLIQPARKVEPVMLPVMHRYTDEQLRELQTDNPIPRPWRIDPPAVEPGSGPPPLGLYSYLDSREVNVARDALIAFLKREGVVAVLERGGDTAVRSAAGGELIAQRTQRVDGGTVFLPTSLPGLNNQQRLLPWLVVAVEQYNRMVRLSERGIKMTAAIDVEVAWYAEQEPGNGINTLGEIAGSDLKDEIVMLGAHLDGPHSASAAVDNGAGSAVVMEVARLLKRVGAKPRRTIRFALWAGEEQGVLGSHAYVERHFGDAAVGPPYRREACRMSAYFNLDNGSGRIRGLFAHHNIGAVAELTRWIEPLHDLGVTVIVPRATQGGRVGTKFTSGSDHQPFDALGIPVIEPVQDRLDYFSRTAHSNMDYLDRASPDDMVQAAVVLASLVYQASMSDQRLPRRLIPPRLGSDPRQVGAPNQRSSQEECAHD